MMRFLLIIGLIAANFKLVAQDVNTLIKDGQNFERSLKEKEALNKYKEALKIDRNNLFCLLHTVELSCAIGNREEDKKVKSRYINEAMGYAEAAMLVDPNSADAYYVRALVAARLTDIETDTKKTLEHVKNIKIYAEKALAINPNHARANYVMGKWNYEMVNLAWAKKAAVKLLYGGLPGASIENAFTYMEKARQYDQYFLINYLDLAKAYKYDQKPAKAVEILNKLVKLPLRTADDAQLKEEGRKMLNEMQ